MPYTVLIKRQAAKKLQSLPRNERTRVAEKIQMLGFDPDDPSLEVKKLQGEPFYRLRVGNWRVIFDRRTLSRSSPLRESNPRETHTNESAAQPTSY